MDIYQQIKEECLRSTETSPIKHLCQMMQKDYVHMHLSLIHI